MVFRSERERERERKRVYDGDDWVREGGGEGCVCAVVLSDGVYMLLCVILGDARTAGVMVWK